jgi:uncharacterized repeat protein (TIGR01451 family)
VQVTDLLPAGLTFVSATPSQGTYNSTSGLWTLGTVNPSTPQTLVITATVVSSAAQTNTATLSHSDQFDPVATNNSASATETPQQADLALAKSVSNTTPNVGDTITFTVTITDKGPNSATNVQVTDLLPAGLTFVSANPSQGTYDIASGVWSVGTVTTAAPQTLQIQAIVASPAAQTNTASISNSDQFDPATANNTASATETPKQADLVLAKTVSNAAPNVGDTITFTVTLSNNGPNWATNVQVADLLPGGLVFVSATPSQGTYSSISGAWVVGTVTTTVPQTLLIQARVASPNAQTNTASISHNDRFDPNTANNTATATETPQQSDLTLSKTVSNATPNVGDTITFTVTLSNTGPNQATNVQVTEVLPTGLTFVSATASQGTYASATGLWTVGTVTTATPQTLQIQAKVVSQAAQTNIASINHSDQFDPNTANNTASATETPQQSDLHLTKTVSNAAPNVGDTVTFTVTLSNTGPNNATNVQVNDLLPAGLTFVSATPSQGTYNNTSGLWTVGTVTATTPQTLLIQATVASPGAATNTAAISHSDQFDPDPGNNSAGATVTPQQADLQISKAVSNPTPNVNDTITYTITLTDNGPNSATNVKVQDTLPSGVSFVSSNPSQGTYDNATGVWTVGTVNPGAPQTLIISATVTSPNPQTNTAAISHADQFDPDPANNGDTASVNPQHADLAVAKTVSNPTPNVGDVITFTVTLTDNGPSSATNVRVTDLLPAGLTFVSSTPSQGTYVSSTGLWTVGTLPNGAHATLALQARVVSPVAQTNTATISHADQFDPVTGNNSASATETPQRADLAVRKTVSNATPNVGDIITFAVGLADLGPNPATNVQVTDLLPTGFTFISATPSQGTYVAATGLWTVGAVATSTPQTLLIRARVASAAAQTNTATISHADQFDPNKANNSASATVTPQQADLALAKTVNDATPNVGEIITYTVTLTNKGPNAATNVSILDLLPSGVSFISASPSLGAYNSGTGLWTIAAIPNGGTATLTLTAQVVSPSTQTNTATITGADQFDPNTANNTASAAQTPKQADLALAKTVSNATPNVGDTVTFTVTLTNNGYNWATNVQVTDRLPAGLAFVSATPSQGTYDNISGVWAVGTVTTTMQLTLQISARVFSSQPQTNTATVSAADQFDPNPANNSASATETPQQADLVLAKSVSDPTPNVGATISFVVTLTNKGPNSATDVTVLDPLPAGLTFVSATPSTGTYDPATGIWTVGAVTTTTPQTLTLTARVASPLPVTNTATVLHADQFDPDLANNTASATETPQQADLNLAKTVDNPTPHVGDVITFTVTLTDLGPDPATHVLVSDRLPTGLTFVSATPSTGSYNPITAIWTVGTVTPGTPVTLTLRARVTVQNSLTNTATITQSDQFDPDPTNNKASATETPVAPRADLVLTKTANQSQVYAGMNVTYTFVIHNLGPSPATGVIVSDPFPPGLVFVSAATPSQGTYNPATGIWSVGTLNNGAMATLSVTARVMVIAPIVNTATASAVELDPDLSNNFSSIAVTGLNPASISSKRSLLASRQ